MWKNLKEKTNRLIKDRRGEFNKNIHSKFIEAMDLKRFHRGVKAFLSAEEVQKWDVRSIFPNRSDLEVAEDLADFFNGISSEYEPLHTTRIPTTYDEPLPQLTVGEVSERLRRSKKTASLV